MRAISILFGVALAFVAQRASADDLALAWRAPEGCPAATEVHDAAMRSAGDAHEPLEADVQVDRADSDRWTVVVRTKRGGIAAAERRLDATSCAGLADATAVILALALSPSPSASPVPSPSVSPSPSRSPETPSSPTDSPAYDHALSTSASLATDATTLPAPAIGAHVAFAYLPGRARIEIAGSYFSGQSKTTASSSAGADFTLLSAGLRGCWAIVRSDVELSPCAGADLQQVSASGFGAAQNFDTDAAWLSAAGGLLLRMPLTSWLALRAQADAVVPLSRPRFVVEGDGAVHQPSAIGARAGIGAELLFL